MKEQWTKIIEWINRRSQNERMLIFILALVLIYILWWAIVLRPLKAKQEELRFATSNLENQTTTIQKQITLINTIVTSKAFSEALIRQKKMERQEGQLRGQLSNVSTLFTPPQFIPQIIKDMIAAQSSQIEMTSLTTTPSVPLLSTELKNMVSFNQAIYQYGIQLEFRSNYFNAIEYLARLEKYSMAASSIGKVRESRIFHRIAELNSLAATGNDSVNKS